MNASLTRAAVDTLSGLGMHVVVSDLYAENFQPVAGRGDFRHRHSLDRLSIAHEQRHAAPTRAFADDILREQDRIVAADVLLFQFPLWWYAVPAILKGWADRVLAEGFAFTQDALFEDGLLRGKRAMIAVTTGGTQQELYDDRRHTGTIEEFLKPFTGGVLSFVGLEVLPAFVAYAPASLSPEGREAQLGDYRAHLLTHIG
ncbi:NAD(P)H-dependent oxidoreductase [Variovorax sp. LjRoot290]